VAGDSVDVGKEAMASHLDFLQGVQKPQPKPQRSAELLGVEVADQPDVAAALERVGDVTTLEVTTREQYGAAAEVVASLSRGIKAAEHYKKEVRAPLAQKLRDFDAGCNEVIGQLVTAKATVNGRMATWKQAEEVLNAQLAEEARAAAEALNEQFAAKARAAGLPEPPPVEMYIAPPPTTVDTPLAGGKVVMTSRWTYAIDDPTLVPREYCQPSPGLIHAAVMKGVRSIPGVRIFQTDSAGYRSR